MGLTREHLLRERKGVAGEEEDTLEKKEEEIAGEGRKMRTLLPLRFLLLLPLRLPPTAFSFIYESGRDLECGIKEHSDFYALSILFYPSTLFLLLPTH
jgi:hypothetical protein